MTKLRFLGLVALVFALLLGAGLCASPDAVAAAVDTPPEEAAVAAASSSDCLTQAAAQIAAQPKLYYRVLVDGVTWLLAPLGALALIVALLIVALHRGGITRERTRTLIGGCTPGGLYVSAALASGQELTGKLLLTGIVVATLAAAGIYGTGKPAPSSSTT